MKRNLMIVALLTAVFVAGATVATRSTSGKISAVATAGIQDFDPSDIERAELGLTIAPVPLGQVGIGRGRLLVGLGSYLVDVGGCNDCHTNPSYKDGGNPFMGQPEQVNTAGYLGGGMMFGPFTSRNLTPDPKEGNLPAGLTLEDFIKTLRTGKDPDNAHPQMGPLLQVMPWPNYGKMTDRDLEAIYNYLLHIPSVDLPRT
jgi:hypothetical protein